MSRYLVKLLIYICFACTAMVVLVQFLDSVQRADQWHPSKTGVARMCCT